MCPEAHTIGGGDQVFWVDAAPNALNLNNQVATIAFTDLDLTAHVTADTIMVMLQLVLRVDVIGAGNQTSLGVRPNGLAPANYPQLNLDKAGVTAASIFTTFCIVGCDAGEVIEYTLTLGAGWTVDLWINVLGYIE